MQSKPTYRLDELLGTEIDLKPLRNETESTQTKIMLGALDSKFGGITDYQKKMVDEILAKTKAPTIEYHHPEPLTLTQMCAMRPMVHFDSYGQRSDMGNFIEENLLRRRLAKEDPIGQKLARNLTPGGYTSSTFGSGARCSFRWMDLEEKINDMNNTLYTQLRAKWQGTLYSRTRVIPPSYIWPLSKGSFYMGACFFDHGHEIGKRVEVYRSIRESHTAVTIAEKGLPRADRVALAPNSLFVIIDGGLLLEEHELEIMYRSGSKNWKAFFDALINAKLFRPRVSSVYRWLKMEKPRLLHSPVSRFGSRQRQKEAFKQNFYRYECKDSWLGYQTAPLPYNAMKTNARELTHAERFVLKLEAAHYIHIVDKGGILTW